MDKRHGGRADANVMALPWRAATEPTWRENNWNLTTIVQLSMLKTGTGLDTDEVHAYLRQRVAGKSATVPTARPWQS